MQRDLQKVNMIRKLENLQNFNKTIVELEHSGDTTSEFDT